MSNEQAIMDAFAAKSLEIIALKETNRALLEALKAFVNHGTCFDALDLAIARAAINKAEGAPS